MSNKTKQTNSNHPKKSKEFFVDIPDDVFKKMLPQIEKYNKKSDASSETTELTGEMLLKLSKQLKANKKRKN